MRCSPRWRTSTISRSPTARRTARSVRERRRASRRSGIRPDGSQCAPWMTHGTTCSSRQKTARRSPRGSSARKPSSRSTASPHQLQGSRATAAEAIGAHGVAIASRAGGYRGQRCPNALRSSSSKAIRPARSCSSRRCACSTPRSAVSISSSTASTCRWPAAARPPTRSSQEAAAAMREAGYGIKAATDHARGRGRRRLAEPACCARTSAAR